MAVSDANQNDVGIIGLNIIGRKAAYRLASHHFKVAAYDWESTHILALREQADGPRVRVAARLSDLISSLRPPRMVLIFSGPDAPMDFVLEQLLPELEQGDLLMDAGNSDYKETALHDRALARLGIQFLAVGLAGGEKGARDGAAVMAGGRSECRHRTRLLLEALADMVREEPCVSYFETPEAAHFVKMVHAGIESALLQLVCETFDLLQRTLLLTDEELHDASGGYHLGVLNGYLAELCGRILKRGDPQSPRRLMEQHLEAAKRDALGKWIVQSGRELQVPMPTIEAAVATPHFDCGAIQSDLASAPFRHPAGRWGDDPESVLDGLHGALQAAMLITYAQGMALLLAASKQLGFHLRLHEIARAWRGCAPLRVSLLDDITAALESTPDLPGLLCDDDLSERVMACQENLRHAVWRARELDIPAPALLASLDYLDTDRTAWMPVNLIQVQRRQSPAFS